MTKFEALKTMIEARRDLAEALKTLGLENTFSEMIPAEVTVTLDLDACLDTYVGPEEAKRELNVGDLKKEIATSAEQTAEDAFDGQIKINVQYGAESPHDADLVEEIHYWVVFTAEEPEVEETEEEVDEE